MVFLLKVGVFWLGWVFLFVSSLVVVVGLFIWLVGFLNS